MEVKDLYFAYGDGKEKNSILEGIDLTIASGKITTLLGANGCGKSTLFQLMTKNLIPQKGKILLDGQDIAKMKQKAFAKKVAIVHQNNVAANDITVRKLVAYGRTPHLGMFGAFTKEDDEIVEWAMQEAGIFQQADQEVMHLSGGQRQRAWIAMALAQKTELLFLDEPTTYLDIRYQIELLEMIERLNREHHITIVMVLHDMNHAIYYSDQIIGLKDKKVICQGKPKDVVTSDFIEKVYGIRLEIMEKNDRRVVIPIR